MLLSLVIAVFVVFSAVRGGRRGLVLEVVELVGLVAAIAVAALAGPTLGNALSVLSDNDNAADAAGKVVVFIVVIVGVALVSRWVRRNDDVMSRPERIADRIGGGVFATIWSLLLVTGVLLLSVTVPGARARTIRPICDSGVARVLIGGSNPLHTAGERVAEFGRPVLLWASQRVFETFTLVHDERLCEELAAGSDEVQRTFRFPAVEPSELTVSSSAEQEVLRLLNEARREAGVAAVEADVPLREVARDHARDMYLRGYFDHDTPECEPRGDTVPAGTCRDPFDRMRAAGIDFDVAGENLALAPTEGAAHTGLLDSPGHRRNMLDPDFTRVGIAVIEGPYGLMVAQEFVG